MWRRGAYRKYESTVLSPLRCILWWGGVGVGVSEMVQRRKIEEGKKKGLERGEEG
jgi:hypothetical protein